MIETLFIGVLSTGKLPIAAVLIIFLNGISSKYSLKIIFLLLFAISTPAGAFFGEYLLNFDIFKNWSNNFLAISCGMLLHITTLLIFEEHHHSKRKFKNILTISAGIVSGILIFSF
ncbi:MAG: hypothetical protein CL827_04355 [Crocinitomicaceae bacterium]|nr:hypothetical protein [Crocinitomicaceae bacterium]|tara:strand:+ start:91 stop:438 length:348 start_codon:yes stop_codon:yes gene_type:complete